MHVFPAVLFAIPTLLLQSGRVVLSVPPSERAKDYLLVSQIITAPVGSEGAQWQTYSLNVQLHREDDTCKLRVLGHRGVLDHRDPIRLVHISPSLCDISEVLRA